MGRVTPGVDEHEPRRTGLRLLELFSHHVTQKHRKVCGTSPGRGLWLAEALKAPVDLDDLPTDDHRAAKKVQIHLAQPEHLGPADPGIGRSPHPHAEPWMDSPSKVGDLPGGEHRDLAFGVRRRTHTPAWRPGQHLHGHGVVHDFAKDRKPTSHRRGRFTGSQHPTWPTTP
jgi:hypothetical protein